MEDSELMRAVALSLIVLLSGVVPAASAYDPNFDQKVKYHQSRVNWKIQEGKERMRKAREARSSAGATYGSSGSAAAVSSYSSNSSSSSRSTAASAAGRPSTGPSQALQSFISMANRANRIEYLYPYALKGKTEYWQRLSTDNKMKELRRIKNWTGSARMLSVDNKGALATIKLQGRIRGVNMWVENGQWKYSDDF